MADTDTDTEGHAPARSGVGGLQRKWHGAPIWAWTLGGTIAVVAAVKWWRGRSSAAAASTATGTSTVENCYDLSGNLVPCAQAAANNASGGGDLGGTLGGILTGTTATGTTSSTGTGGPSTSSTSTTTGTPTSGRLTPPIGLHLANPGKTGVKVSWLAVPGAVGYVALCKKGGNNGQTVNGPFNVGSSQLYANFGGLQAGTKYTAMVWPSSSSVEGGPGSKQPHAEYAFTTSK